MAFIPTSSVPFVYVLGIIYVMRMHVVVIIIIYYILNKYTYAFAFALTMVSHMAHTRRKQKMHLGVLGFELKYKQLGEGKGM